MADPGGTETHPFPNKISAFSYIFLEVWGPIWVGTPTLNPPLISFIQHKMFVILKYLLFFIFSAEKICEEGDLTVYDSVNNDDFLLDYPEEAHVCYVHNKQKIKQTNRCRNSNEEPNDSSVLQFFP